MENAQIADIFDEIADLIDLNQGNEDRIRAYRAAARTIRDLAQRLEEPPPSLPQPLLGGG